MDNQRLTVLIRTNYIKLDSSNRYILQSGDGEDVDFLGIKGEEDAIEGYIKANINKFFPLLLDAAKHDVKTCPCCGGHALREWGTLEEHRALTQTYTLPDGCSRIFCRKCGLNTGWELTALERWNRRI
jgi:hypothetical protein